MKDQEGLKQANRRLVRRLLLVAVGMFGFGFALVPIYDVFCNLTGINGKTGRIAVEEVSSTPVDKGRLVTVEFVANINGNLSWEFRPVVRKVRVHPGEVGEASYIAKNLTDRTVVAQAIPSLAPGLAAKYFRKIECFCFTRQKFSPGEKREMPLRFVVASDLPREISTVTLSYTFFDIERKNVKKNSRDGQLTTG